MTIVWKWKSIFIDFVNIKQFSQQIAFNSVDEIEHSILVQRLAFGFFSRENNFLGFSKSLGNICLW